jgi:hypothetical protein
MSTKAVHKLKELVHTDEALRKKLGSITTGQDLYATLISVGAEKGLVFTKGELESVIAQETRGESTELTPDEIASMAGRFHIHPPKTATVRFGDTLIRTSRWFGIPLRR